MSELTNKELAEFITLYVAATSDEAEKALSLASERLAQYPDMHHTEATNFRDLANKFLKLRDERDRLQSIIDSMVDQRSRLHSRFKDRKGQSNPEADFMAPNDPVERLAAMPDVGEQEPAVRLKVAKRAFDEFLILDFENIGLQEAGEYFLYTQPQQPAPDRETIKRYCLDFADYRDERFRHASLADKFERLDSDVFEEFWQQQSAESDQ